MSGNTFSNTQHDQIPSCLRGPHDPNTSIFVVAAINQTIKSKTGFIGAFWTKGLASLQSGVQCCKMQAKQDYSTAGFHMVSLLQEKYSTALVQDWVQYYFQKNTHTKKKITHLCPWVFGKDGNSLSFLSWRSQNHFWSIKSSSQRYDWRPAPDSCLFD